MKAYYSSIELSPELQRNDQYLNTAPSTSNSTVTIAEIAGGVIVLGLVIWLIFRKKNNRELA